MQERGIENFTGGVPLVDLSAFRVDPDGDAAAESVETLREACERVGFLVITGHGFPPEQIEAMYSVTRAFFHLPEEQKRATMPAAGIQLGYRPLASAAVSRSSGRETPPDLCEVFRYNLLAVHEARERGAVEEVLDHVFPEEPANFREEWLRWFSSVEDLGRLLLRIMARALELPDHWFEPHFEQHSAGLIANYYPRQETPPEEGQLRKGPHTDFGVLTILYQDDAGGLEVIDPNTGRWLPVPFVPDSFVVNIGDLMEHWTNGRWVSTQHQVVNPTAERSQQDRISIPFFFNPDVNALITTIETCIPEGAESPYAPVTAGQWMENKLRLGTYAGGTA